MRDEIEWTQITLGSRRIGFDRAHDDAFIGALEQIADRRVITQCLNANAQPGARDFMAGDQLCANFFGDVNGNREAQAAVHPVDQRVHANHFAVDITERAAAVTRINRGVGLQIIRDRVAACLEQFAPAFAADHAIRECVIELEGCADCKRKLPHPYRVAVPKLDDRQIVRVDLDDGDVGFFIGADDPCGKRPPISQFHVDFVRAFDYVEVCKNVAVLPHDETGAFALDRSQPAWIASRIVFIWRPLKKQVVQRRAFAHVVLF